MSGKSDSVGMFILWNHFQYGGILYIYQFVYLYYVCQVIIMWTWFLLTVWLARGKLCSSTVIMKTDLWLMKSCDSCSVWLKEQKKHKFSNQNNCVMKCYSLRFWSVINLYIFKVLSDKTVAEEQASSEFFW